MTDQAKLQQLKSLHKKLNSIGHYNNSIESERNIFMIVHDLEKENFSSSDMCNMIKALQHNLIERDKQRESDEMNYDFLGGDSELQRLRLKLDKVES